MSPLILIAVVAGLVAIVACPKEHLMRSLILLAITAFCGFGFLASFEPGVSLLWKAGYLVAGISSLAAAVYPRIPKQSREVADN